MKTNPLAEIARLEAEAKRLEAFSHPIFLDCWYIIEAELLKRTRQAAVETGEKDADHSFHAGKIFAYEEIRRLPKEAVEKQRDSIIAELKGFQTQVKIDEERKLMEEEP